MSTEHSVLGRGVPLNSQALELLRRVRNFYEQEKIFVQEHGHPSIPAENVIERTAATLGLTVRTVIRKGVELQAMEDKVNESLCEHENEIAVCETPRLSTPGKKRKRMHSVTEVDGFQEDAIRRHIYSYYEEKKYPTLQKLVCSLKECDLFNGSATSLRRILKGINFTFKPFNGRQLLLEKRHVVVQRTLFLQKLVEEDIDKIVWLDETWVNACEALSKGWTDGTPESNINKPSGKGGRLIVVHAGSASGFVPNALLVFKSKKTVDYHEEMDGPRFESWFVNLLNSLEEPTTIVMDNAPYHSVQISRVPTSNSRKEEMAAWLQSKNIDVTPTMSKVGLFSLIKENRPVVPEYRVDQLALERGHKVIRLPPYHCHFNPIELIWADIKHYIRKHNNKFTLTEVERLLREVVDKISASVWYNKVQHVKKLVKEAQEIEGIISDNCELMISLNDDSDGEIDEDLLEGFQPL